MRKVLYITWIVLILFSCKKHKENKVEPGKEYIKYVDTQSILTDLVPLDVIRTNDDGYLVLGSSASPDILFHRTYLMKLDKEGNFEWDGYLPKQFLNPVSELLYRNGEYFIVCMDEATSTHLVKISPQVLSAVSVKRWDNIQLPLHASFTPDGGILLLNANLADKWTGFTKVRSDYSTEWSKEYYFSENFAADIDRHVKRESLPLSFLTGTVQKTGRTTSYYFNAFYEANFSCVFVNPNNGETGGYSLIGGDRAYAAIRYVVPLEANFFALTRYDRSGNNLLIPLRNVNITSSEYTASTELGGIRFPDMEPGSRILCRRHTVGGRDVLLFASNTRNKGISLYAYDVRSGGYLGSKAFNLETPCEMAGFVLSQDGGMTVVAKTYIANRFPRICIFKISEEDLKRWVGV